MYVASTTLLSLNAFDTSSNTYAMAGVATTYYLVDAVADAACLAVPYDAGAPGGSCANPVYAGAFRLPEGRHSIGYFGVDKIGNYGGVGISSISVDGTPPQAGLALNGAPLADGATVTATAADVITLSAADRDEGGPVSGLATAYFLIDITPEECEYSDWSGGVSGAGSAGSCENPFYTGPVTLPEGEHIVYYLAEDNVGNRESRKNVVVSVETVDTKIKDAAKQAKDFYERATKVLKSIQPTGQP